MKLDLFGDLGIDEVNLHGKFRLLKQPYTTFGLAGIVECWTEGFQDRDNKIVHEFQTSFHSAFWEFYLHKIFKDAGHVVNFSQARPDFILTSPEKIIVEAVVAEIKKNGIKESDRTIDDILSMSFPPHLQPDFYDLIDEAIVRNSNAILSKSKKYLESYKALSWVDDRSPFVVAMSSFDQVNYGREYNYGMLALLYGQYYNTTTRGYDFKSAITKKDTGSEIPIGLFNNTSYQHISAVIFTCTLTLGKLQALYNSELEVGAQLQRVLNVRHNSEYPFYEVQLVNKNSIEELSDGLFVFHNPYAINELPDDFLANTNAFRIHPHDNGFNAYAKSSPLVSRLNLPRLTTPDQVLSLLIDQMEEQFNR